MRYAAPVSDARFNLRLAPVDWPGQTISHASLTVSPPAAALRDVAGPYHVKGTRADFAAPIQELEVISAFTAQITHQPLADEGPRLGKIRELSLEMRDIAALSPAPYLFNSRIAVADRAIGAWSEQGAAPDVPVLALAQALSKRLHREFAYKPGATSSRTPPAEAFARRHGVCQDFAHVLIIALRWLGVPAAYASGYLRTVPPPGREKLVGADAMHAWVNVWCGPELGWIGIDPTNDRLAGEDHILIAAGRDYADVAPIDGTFIGAAPQKMVSAVDVLEAGGGDAA